MTCRFRAITQFVLIPLDPWPHTMINVLCDIILSIQNTLWIPGYTRNKMMRFTGLRQDSVNNTSSPLFFICDSTQNWNEDNVCLTTRFWLRWCAWCTEWCTEWVLLHQSITSSFSYPRYSNSRATYRDIIKDKLSYFHRESSHITQQLDG